MEDSEMADFARQTEIKFRRLGKLADEITKRLERVEESSALTVFVQDGLVQEVTKLLDQVEQHQARERERFMKSDVFEGPKDHEDYQPS